MVTCLQSLSVKLPLQVRSCPVRLRVRCTDSLEDHFPGDQKAHTLVAQPDHSLKRQTGRSPEDRKDHSFEGRRDRFVENQACDFLVDLEDHSSRVRLLEGAGVFLG